MLPFIYRGDIHTGLPDNYQTDEYVYKSIASGLEAHGASEMKWHGNKVSFTIPLYRPFPYRNWQALPFASLVDCGEVSLKRKDGRLIVHIELSFMRWLLVCLAALPLSIYFFYIDPTPWLFRILFLLFIAVLAYVPTVVGVVFMRTIIKAQMKNDTEVKA